MRAAELSSQAGSRGTWPATPACLTTSTARIRLSHATQLEAWPDRWGHSQAVVGSPQRPGSRQVQAGLPQYNSPPAHPGRRGLLPQRPPQVENGLVAGAPPARRDGQERGSRLEPQHAAAPEAQRCSPRGLRSTLRARGHPPLAAASPDARSPAQQLQQSKRRQEPHLLGPMSTWPMCVFMRSVSLSRGTAAQEQRACCRQRQVAAGGGRQGSRGSGTARL